MWALSLSEDSVTRRIYLGIGSSDNRETNIRGGVKDLCEAFPSLVISSVYETEAMGFVGDPFYNLVVGFDSDIGLRELFVMVRAIEEAHGRKRESKSCEGKMLDIDILTFGGLVGSEAGISLPRDEVLKHAFVLCPLAEIAPLDVHPVAKKNYATLWSEFSADQGIRKIEFEW